MEPTLLRLFVRAPCESYGGLSIFTLFLMICFPLTERGYVGFVSCELRKSLFLRFPGPGWHAGGESGMTRREGGAGVKRGGLVGSVRSAFLNTLIDRFGEIHQPRAGADPASSQVCWL